MKRSQPVYYKVSFSEESPLQSHLLNPLPPRRDWHWLRILYLLLKASIVVFSLYGFYIAILSTVTISRAPSPSARAIFNTLAGHLPPSLLRPSLHSDGYLVFPHQRSCRCGNTLEEAIANRCKYDSHALAWLPHHCRDEELLREWETAGSGDGGQWEYFATQSGDFPLNLTEVSLLPYTGRRFYMTMEWHVKECTESLGGSLVRSLRKQYRSLALGITMDRKSDGLHHIAHCEKNFLRRNDLQSLVTGAGVSLDADQGEGKLELWMRRKSQVRA